MITGFLNHLVTTHQAVIGTNFELKTHIMVTDTVIDFFLALQHARVPTAAGFSIISYSLKNMGKNSSAHFAILSLDSIIHLSCIFGGKPGFGLSIISWAKNGLNFLYVADSKRFHQPSVFL